MIQRLKFLSPSKHYFRPQLEALEDRTVPNAATALAPPDIGPAIVGQEVAAGNPVAQGLGAARTFVTHLTGDAEVPSRETLARGQAIFKLSKDGTELHFRLIVANIENVVAAHIHLGPEGVNGPVVAFLMDDLPPGGGRFSGVLSTGTITADDLVGPLEGEDFSALIDAMLAGDTYVNVHTNDGVPGSDPGPGNFPPGEVRGQIRLAGPPSPPSMEAANAFSFALSQKDRA